MKEYQLMLIKGRIMELSTELQDEMKYFNNGTVQCLLTYEEMLEFDKALDDIVEKIEVLIDLCEQEMIEECRVLIQEIEEMLDKVDEYPTMASLRLDGDLSGMNMGYYNFIERFIDDIDEPLDFDYHEAYEVINSTSPYYISWIDEDDVRRFKSVSDKREAMIKVMQLPNAGKENIYNKYTIK